MPGAEVGTKGHLAEGSRQVPPLWALCGGGEAVQTLPFIEI